MDQGSQTVQTNLNSARCKAVGGKDKIMKLGHIAFLRKLVVLRQAMAQASAKGASAFLEDESGLEALLCAGAACKDFPASAPELSAEQTSSMKQYIAADGKESLDIMMT
eukprot:6488113-Amphidinium_carterae.2